MAIPLGAGILCWVLAFCTIEKKEKKDHLRRKKFKKLVVLKFNQNGETIDLKTFLVYLRQYQSNPVNLCLLQPITAYLKLSKTISAYLTISRPNSALTYLIEV